MKKLYSVLSFVILTCSLAQATGEVRRLQDASYLRKLSFHVRGVPPSASEYVALKSAQAAGKQTEFFDQKIEEYLDSDRHAHKLSFRLEELFRLRTMMDTSVAFPSGVKPEIPYYERNSINRLFMSLAKENLPWDTLLMGKSYEAYPKFYSDLLVTSDFAFLHSLLPDLMPRVGDDLVADAGNMVSKSVKFQTDDPRIAGALTTSRFFNRYTTTELNKNRRRAAAVFNVFLCDSMAAAVPPPPSDPGGILDRAFPSTSEVTEEEIARMKANSDKHGSDQACAQCHYKLDPMGRAFAASTVTLSPRPTAGRLVYKDKRTGVLVDRPGRGIGDLALEITKQAQYVDCQISYFWKWFIGEDRTMPDARRAQLTQAFDSVGRRTNDFIKVLLKAPEFRELDFRTIEEVRVAQVKSVLKKCMDCHGSLHTPDLLSWPIGGSPQQMQHWVNRISIRLDLPNDGAKRTMPPSWSPWSPSTEDIELLKKWVEDGAPDAQGNRQI